MVCFVKNGRAMGKVNAVKQYCKLLSSETEIKVLTPYLASNNKARVCLQKIRTKCLLFGAKH